ncbi:aspartyl protease family protein [Rudanella lutea]|uniref:aspartyl protease family protein n=1 Tax=Rudanella lutea TaxID=451374 RepID=UPI000365B8C0|nr:aspartyl protease family protein [Rudanella lutea]
MKVLLLVMGWLFCLGSSVQATPDKHVPDKDRFGFFLAGNRSWARIPFQLHSNLIIIPIRINNSDTLRFILDTGVSSTIVTDPKAIRNQKLRFTRKVKLAGAGEGGNLTASVAIDNQLSIGYLRANRHNIVVLDEDVLKLSEYVGVPIHGIFGYDLFNTFVVTIDFQLHEITLTRPDKYRYRQRHGEKYPITIQDTKPYTDAMTLVEGNRVTPLRVILDTGAGHALLLDRTRNPENLPLPDRIIRAQLGRGLNGVINGSMGRLPKVRFGRYELDNILASFPDSVAFGTKLTNSPERVGNVGCELLRRFKITFNYRDGFIVMKPIRRIMKETFEHDMSGLELKARGESFQNYYIGRIIEGSPADLAGLVEGDELLLINNTAAHNMSISDIYKLLQRGEGKEVTMVVRRKGHIALAQFVLKRVI